LGIAGCHEKTPTVKPPTIFFVTNLYDKSNIGSWMWCLHPVSSIFLRYQEVHPNAWNGSFALQVSCSLLARYCTKGPFRLWTECDIEKWHEAMQQEQNEKWRYRDT
jgi:hypothetical protein